MSTHLAGQGEIFYTVDSKVTKEIHINQPLCANLFFLNNLRTNRIIIDLKPIFFTKFVTFFGLLKILNF